MTSPAVKKLLTRAAQACEDALGAFENNNCIDWGVFAPLAAEIRAALAEAGFREAFSTAACVHGIPLTKTCLSCQRIHIGNVEAEEAAPVYVPVAKLSAETMAAEPKWTVEDAIGWNKQWKADMLKPTDAPPPTDTVTFKIPAEVAAAMATEPARVADGEWCMPIPAEYVITDAMIEAAMDAIKPHGVNRDNMRAALAAALKAGRA